MNKVDDANREAAAWEFVSLGLGDPYPVSALHGRGTGDLLDAVVGPTFHCVETEYHERGRPRPVGGRRVHAQGGDRRPAERRQVHALQPAPRRGALHRARLAGHDPRRHRHGGRHARRPGLLRRHGRAAPAGATTERGTEQHATLRALAPSNRPTSPFSSSTRRRVRRTRTNAWPSASVSRAAPPSSC